MAGTRRRSHKPFGHVEERPNGRYRGRYTHAGKRITSDPFLTKADARAWLTKAHNDILKDEWVDPGRKKKVIFRDYADEFARRPSLGEGTQAKYESLLRLHIHPAFGDAEVRAIQPMDVRTWYDELVRSKSKNTGDDCYRVLRAVLKQAEADGLISKMPCRIKGAGYTRRQRRPILNVAQAEVFVEKTPERYRAAIVLAAWCGLRREETLGLQRKHLDVDNWTVHVVQAVTVVRGRAVLVPTKSEASERTLSIPPGVRDFIAYHLKTYVGADQDAWLFTSERGPRVHPRTLSRAFEVARLAEGHTGLHLHDLRHTSLTWYGRAGATLAEIMERGGQSTVAAAMNYQQTVLEADRHLAERMPGTVRVPGTEVVS